MGNIKMDFKKIFGQAKQKATDFLAKDSTKKAIEQAKEAASKIKDEFDDVCDKADVKLKEQIDNYKNKDSKDGSEKDSEEVVAETKEEAPVKEVVAETKEEAPVEEVVAETKEEAPVEDVSSDESNDLKTLGFSDKIVAALIAADIKDIASLKKLSTDEISEIKGIGKATVKKIEESIK
jgi:DNA integrity scanning protein DisA with diadenylate cyclase activity